MDRRRLEAQMLPRIPYRNRVDLSQRPDEVFEEVNDHIWNSVNKHLHTSARSYPELVEQLGIMRFGHRPQMADPFCGSGQIPFEAARLGCDVYAADLNPVATMLTWGAFNIIGKPIEFRTKVADELNELLLKVQKEIDDLGIESDGTGWRARNYLYCLEARCPRTGWIVPLIPSLVISEDYGIVADLVPIPSEKDTIFNFVLAHDPLK